MGYINKFIRFVIPKTRIMKNIIRLTILLLFCITFSLHSQTDKGVVKKSVKNKCIETGKSCELICANKAKETCCNGIEKKTQSKSKKKACSKSEKKACSKSEKISCCKSKKTSCCKDKI